jgi:hypothetical protein
VPAVAAGKGFLSNTIQVGCVVYRQAGLRCRAGAVPCSRLGLSAQRIKANLRPEIANPQFRVFSQG